MNGSPAASPINRSQLALRSVAAQETHVSSLIISTELHDTIVQHLGRCIPDEGVGLLATRQIGSSWIAVRFYPGRNIDSSPRRYTMDPADVLTALADMKREQTRLGAIVHSHPKTPAVPSRTDVVEARYPGVLNLIVGFASEVEMLAWRFIYDGHGVAVRFDEVAVVYSDTSERARLGFLPCAGHNRGTSRHPVKGST